MPGPTKDSLDLDADMTGVQMRDAMGQLLQKLRYEPTAKRIRATLGGRTVVDTTRAMLVWEPRRVVPGYAVPYQDIHAEISLRSSTPLENDAVGFMLPDLSKVPVFDPRIPFDVRTTAGEPVEVRVPETDAAAAGFRAHDPGLADHVILAFADFDTWFEEDDEIISHPHDPYGRIDIRGTSRHVQLMLDGHVLADTTRARMLFETNLPARYYLPMEDVVAPLEPSSTSSMCSYKGYATWYSATIGDQRVDDIAWQYEHPLSDAADVRDYVAFLDERLDLVIDGEQQKRSVTPWS
ncbi:DUF427 domain-containing protein [Arthrobacter agilis]|uniref:DUF427 domain-containing protein n=1 Tax=Arthrobacter agilis TaxID=37921 RepID=UPI00278432D0|nr:DUF427 domain-containing protein [Arthrobacter agilis]MDQ0735005.1 uncharacterized protein (DUF427 family) [Arthrobacter agilis]